MYFAIKMAVSYFEIAGMRCGLSAFQIFEDKWNGLALTTILWATYGKVAQTFLIFSIALAVLFCEHRQSTAQMVIAADCDALGPTLCLRFVPAPRRPLDGLGKHNRHAILPMEKHRLEGHACSFPDDAKLL